MDNQDRPGATEAGIEARKEEIDAEIEAEIQETAATVSHEIAELQAQLEQASERHLRLAADFDNYRRRVERERTEHVARAQAGLLRKLLDVLDDLERVTEQAANTDVNRAFLEGVELIEKKFKQVLEGAGVETIDASDGRFNPETMEAMMRIPTDDPSQDDTVQDVFQKGYRFNGVLIRPARVTVRKHEA